MSPPDRVVGLEGAPNFRDLGGYRTADGRQVRWRRLFRAGSLAELTAADLAVVASLGIGYVFDLRTDLEVTAAPDPDLGARRVHLPVIDGAIDVEALTTAVRSGDLAALPEGLLVSGTARIATEFPDQWAVLLDHFLANPGEATLIHCTGGKDRTGWAAALVLRALGVAPDVVLEDYLLSNACLADRIATRTASVRSTVAANHGVPEDAVDLGGLPGLLGVRQTYLQAAFDAVDAEHGSFDTYLTDALGCSDAQIARLRDDLLE